jgi:predicted transcriptional regulator
MTLLKRRRKTLIEDLPTKLSTEVPARLRVTISEIADSRDTTMSQIVREAIEFYLTHHKPPSCKK